MANSDYVKIPVTPEVYNQVKIISEANGYGPRGLGKQIAAWAIRELPECNHEKQPVEIEYFPDGGDNLDKDRFNKGWYCPTCRRVYARVSED